MIRHAWIAFAAVCCGFLVAWAAGAASTTSLVIPLVALGVALVAKAAHDRNQQAPPLPISEIRLPPKANSAAPQLDAEMLGLVREVVEDRTIAWLAEQDFATTWRDSHLAPLRELRRIDDIHPYGLLDNADGPVRSFNSATAEFIDYYDAHTHADDLVIDGEWREVGPGDHRGSQQDPAGVDNSTIRSELRGRAAAVAEAWIRMKPTMEASGKHDAGAVRSSRR